MTNKTRNFLIGATLLLLVGIGVGLVAYYRTGHFGTIARGLPDELRYVPATAELVAYADVHTVMNSDLRRELERANGNEPKGKAGIHDFAGIDIETQVNHVVAFLEKFEGVEPGPPRGLLLVQGAFEQPKLEQFITEHGGTLEDYHGKRIAVHRRANDERNPQGRVDPMVVGFLQPNLVALGHADLVRRAIDLPANAVASGNVTSNTEMMTMLRDASGDTAWAVGHFDALSRRMGLPNSMRQQVPPLRMVSAKAHINGGVRAIIKAETADQAAADQMRDMIRGFVALIRLQGNAKPDIQNVLKTIELGGTGTTVQLSFAVTPEAVRVLLPEHRGRPGLKPPMPEEPPPPPPPTPPVR